MRARAIFFGVCFGLCAGLIGTAGSPAFAKGLRYRQYTVKAGDTIYDLARRFGCAERDLEQSNELGAVLSIGQKLRIPVCAGDGKGAAKGQAKRETTADAKAGARLARAAAARPLAKLGDNKAAARLEPHGEARSRRASEARDLSARKPAGRPALERGGKIARLEKDEAAPSAPAVPAPPRKKPGRADRVELALAAAAPPGPAELDRAAAASAPAPAADDQPVTSPSAAPSETTAPSATSPAAPAFDPTTGSIAAPAPAAPDAAAPALDEPAAALRSEYDDDAQVPSLARAAAADGPSDHKLVLDGRKLGRRSPPGLAESLDEDDAVHDDALIDARIDEILGDAVPPAGQSVGRPWRGRLKNAARLGYGEGYLLRRPNRAYGTTTTVAHVEHVLAELRRKFPDLHPLAVGDLSLPNGGPVSEHRSHQSGRDIDLGLCFHDKPAGYPEHFVVATEDTLDPAATWALISALVDTAELDGGLEMIFLDYAVQGMIYRWAVNEGIDAARLARVLQYANGRGSGHGIVRHAKNHADHLHARFRCATGEAGCR